MKRLLGLVSLLATTACVSVTVNPPLLAPLSVTHLHSDRTYPGVPPYPHMLYYRTELKNNSDRPLKVVWFEGYTKYGNSWRANNILGKTLQKREFSQWYTEGDKVIDGVILPGQKAVIDVNWHGSKSGTVLPMKWAYIAVDNFGNDYYVDAEVDPALVRKEDL